MAILLNNISSLVTCSAGSKAKKSGIEMQEIAEIKNAAMLFDNEIIWIGNSNEADNFCKENNHFPTSIIDCTGKTILPGFVDSHTHIVFAGSRANEFSRRLQGVSYQQIASEGGGILRTMNAVRNATQLEIEAVGMKLAQSAMRHGTTTIEIKSGYGLTLESELKLLRAVKTLQKNLPLRIIPTFLGAHDFPPEFRTNRSKYIETICAEMIPAVVHENLAEFCDVFTDTGYFTVQESELILQTARDYGLRVKVHADELSSFGAAEMAARMNAVSADHLLFVSENGIEQMRKSGTIATLLPGTAYTLKLPFAPARKMIENDVTVALATDCNPGSCYMENMQMVLSLACTMGGMTVEEAINASTINGAAALGISHQTGSLELGKSADFIIADCADYAELVYHFGSNQVQQVWIRGEKVNQEIPYSGN